MANKKETTEKVEKPVEKAAAPAEKPAPEPQPKADPRQTDGQAPRAEATAQAQPQPKADPPRAEKKSNTWLICCGCGCGCIVVVVILIIIGWMFNFFGAAGGTGGVSEIYNDWRAGTLYSTTPSPK